MLSSQQLLVWLEYQAGSVATAHRQRSFAYIKVALNEFKFSMVPNFIREFDGIIGTPVQTAAKRQDEQEFARLNAENFMFCEDAARKIKS